MRTAHIQDGVVVNISVGAPVEGDPNQIGFEREEGVSIGWTVVNGVLTPPDPEPDEGLAVTPDMVATARQNAYQLYSDPVFFKWQRGTATEQDWLDAVQAVKDDYPYPAEDSE